MPEASAVPVPTTTPSTTILTVWPGVAAPVTVRVLSAVSLSPCTPVSTPRPVIVGPAGRALLMLTLEGLPVAVLPATSVATGVSV